MKKALFIFTLICSMLMLGNVDAQAGTTPYTATTINVNTVYSGTIQNAWPTPENYYKFTIPKSGIVSITHYNYEMEYSNNAYCRIYDSSILSNSEAEYILFAASKEDTNRGCYYVSEKCYLSAGTYYLLIDDFYGSYMFQVAYVEGKETFPENTASPYDYLHQAKAIKFDQDYWGILGNADTQDMYKFTVPCKSDIGFVAVDSSKDNVVNYEILNSSGETVKSIDRKYNENSQTASSICELTLNKGTYYLKVDNDWFASNIDGIYNGQYIFSMDWQPYIGEGKVTITRKKKKMKVKISKCEGATGYEIRYSTKKSMKKCKVVKTKKRTKTIKGLKQKKTYYVKVRAYKVYGGKTYYGGSTKKMKVKK